MDTKWGETRGFPDPKEIKKRRVMGSIHEPIEEMREGMKMLHQNEEKKKEPGLEMEWPSEEREEKEMMRRSGR
ncbi:hypothetical protein PRIPAC_87778 [Pristionchus pacificus]|nr:hypothetical protein PRIPAC_87778 [Pristionchus pacificus]|eukprot:PDM84860.1 hypothetical protein PRIPAC_33883 [Pristionchus pacificus]